MNSYANELLKLIIRTIGNRYGAIDDFFDRHERKAQALPPKYKKRIPEISFLSIDFPLRLYCYRISKDIVVLFNGGYKDKRNAQESKEVSMCFYEAQIYTERIADALKSGMILIDKREKILKDFQSNTEIEF